MNPMIHYNHTEILLKEFCDVLIVIDDNEFLK
jgi:hypothetical protein